MFIGIIDVVEKTLRGLISDMELLTAGERLSVLRKRSGFTQTELARLAGISASSICRYELGTANLSYEALCNIAYALNVTLNKLITGFDDPNSEEPRILIDNTDNQS